ncbi:unnamed protein product, partial [Rotaria sp. Silwood2]
IERHLLKMVFKPEVVLIFASLILSTRCKAYNCPDNETLDLESDGYQYIRGQEPLISTLYREWWFFALYDPLVDVGCSIGHSVADPSKAFGLEGSGISGMLWTSVENNTGQDPINILDSYGFEQLLTMA